jgi:hypothetical protein
VLPEGTPVPQPVEDLRRALAELQLAFADAVQMGAPDDGTAPAAATPPPPAEPPRPKIWTPGGDV